MATSSIHRLTLLPSSSTGCTVPCPPAGLPFSGLQTHHLPVGTLTLASPTVCCMLDQTLTGLASPLGPRSRFCRTEAFRNCPVAHPCHHCHHLVPCSSNGTPPGLGGLAT